MQSKLNDRWEKSELRAFRNKNPFTIMFKFGGSVIDELLAEYLALLIICFTLSFIIGLQVPNKFKFILFFLFFLFFLFSAFFRIFHI